MASNHSLLKTEKPVIADSDLDCTGAPPAWLPANAHRRAATFPAPPPTFSALRCRLRLSLVAGLD